MKLDPATSLTGVATQLQAELAQLQALARSGEATSSSKVQAASATLQGQVEQLAAIKQVWCTRCILRARGCVLSHDDEVACRAPQVPRHNDVAASVAHMRTGSHSIQCKEFNVKAGGVHEMHGHRWLHHNGAALASCCVERCALGACMRASSFCQALQLQADMANAQDVLQELQKGGHSAARRAGALEDACRRVAAEALRRSGAAQHRGAGSGLKGIEDAQRAAAECLS